MGSREFTAPEISLKLLSFQAKNRELPSKASATASRVILSDPAPPAATDAIGNRKDVQTKITVRTTEILDKKNLPGQGGGGRSNQASKTGINDYSFHPLFFQNSTSASHGHNQTKVSC